LAKAGLRGSRVRPLPAGKAGGPRVAVQGQAGRGEKERMACMNWEGRGEKLGNFRKRGFGSSGDWRRAGLFEGGMVGANGTAMLLMM